MLQANRASITFSRRGSLPWLALIGMLALSAIAAEYVRYTKERAEQTQYQYSVKASVLKIRDAIHDRIHIYVGLLRGAAGLFAADGHITQTSFAEYVDQIGLRRNYPGVRGIGYSMIVPPDDEDEITEQMIASGSPEFHIWPDAPEQPRSTVIYLEPLDELNQRAIGYDMFSDPVRREAMEKARDSGQPVASGKVYLVQEPLDPTQRQPGFLIYLPIYQGGKDPGTVELRREALVGFVYCPFRAGDLLRGIGDDPQSALVDYVLYDGPAATDEHHLHQTRNSAMSPNTPASWLPTSSFDIAGRDWTLVPTPRADLAPRPERLLPLGVLGAGCVLSLVLFALMLSQSHARGAAERAASELRQSQAALQQSEDSLRRLVESNLIGVVIADETGRIIQANDAFLSLMGYSREDLAGGTLNWAALTPPEPAGTSPQLPAQIEQTASTTPFAKDYLRKDGSRLPVLAGSTALSETRRVSFIVDLTELRQARGAVLDSERRFRTLVEQSPLGIQIFAPDGHVLLANQAWERIWESKAADLATYNVLTDAQLEKMGLQPYVLAAFAGESPAVPPFRYDPALSGRPGRPRWVQFYFYPVKDQAGVVREVVLVLHDITEVKVAEEALQRSEQQLRLVIDALPVVVAYIDLEKKYRLNNELFEQWFDRPSSEIEGMKAADLIGPEAWKIAEPRVDRALAGNREEFERKMNFPDGTEHDVHVTLIPHVGLADHVEGIVVLMADVTERKMVENERLRLLAAEREARADAELANRTKDEFLATLSHELRTPLNAILGWAQLMKMGDLPEDEAAHGLEAIERNAKVQAQLVEDLLDLSRIISGKLRLDMRPIDLQGVLRAALDSVRPAADAKSIQLLPLFDGSATPVLADAARLQQVIWNLLSNAIKFTPPRGRVELMLIRQGEEAQITVRDTGIGISLDFLPFVFERLRQADSSSTRKHGGLGLGLAIARHLIESHGGTIRAESAGPNRGASFIVSLPIIHGSVLKDAPGIAAGGDGQKARRKLDGVEILIVDDEEDARDLVARVLQKEGAKVRAACSAAEALEAIDQSRPDVLVSDIAMPGEDGYELIRKLRLRDADHGGGLPAIALTAFARGEDRDRALRAGYQTHLAKPVEPARLSDVVAELAGHIVT